MHEWPQLVGSASPVFTLIGFCQCLVGKLAHSFSQVAALISVRDAQLGELSA